MNIYIVSRFDDVSYDQYDAFVVAATNEAEATLFLLKNHPLDYYLSWSDKTSARLIGTTDVYTEPTEILGSFNAG